MSDLGINLDFLKKIKKDLKKFAFVYVAFLRKISAYDFKAYGELQFFIFMKLYTYNKPVPLSCSSNEKCNLFMNLAFM